MTSIAHPSLKPVLGSGIPVSRLTVALALFVFAVGVVLNLVLFVGFDVRTTLHQSVDLLRFHAEDDSWGPMYVALYVLKQTPHPPLYTTVVDLQAKFQYPLTSIMLVEPFMRLPYDLLRSNTILNFISWLSMIGLAVVTALILLRGTALYLGRAIAARPLDSILLAGAAIAASLTFYPAVQSYSLGQIQTWINFLFGVAILAWMYDRRGLAGLMLAVICLIKPQLTVMLVWALLFREWRFFWFFAVPFGVVSLAALLLYPLQDHLDYLNQLSILARYGESYYPNQSLNGLLHRLFHNGDNLFSTQGVFPPYNPWVRFATLLSSAAIIVLALFWRRREHRHASLFAFMILGLSLTMASPIAWEHHYGIMLPIFAAALPATLAAPTLGIGSLVTLAAAYVLSSNYLEPAQLLAESWLNPVQSYLYFGAVLLLVHLYRVRHALHLAAGAEGARAGSFGGAVAGEAR